MLVFIVVFLGKYYNHILIGPLPYFRVISTGIFILSVTFAVALPIFFRTFFAHKHRQRTSLTEGELIRFESRFLHIAMVTPYLAVLAYLLDIPRFHSAGTFLMTLYAVYYYYPSVKRIQFEKRIFRVKPE